MTTTTSKEVGGLAETVIRETNEGGVADQRKRVLLERLGHFFLSCQNPAYSDETRKVSLEACTLFAKECQRVFDEDARVSYSWEVSYLREIEKLGADLDLLDDDSIQIGVRLRLRTDPQFAKKCADLQTEEYWKL